MIASATAGLTAITTIGAVASAAPGFRIDMDLAEWEAIPVAATDPAGDSATGHFDLLELRLASEGARLYARLRFADGDVNLQNGEPTDGFPALRVAAPGERSMTVRFRNRMVFVNDDPQQRLSWTTSGFAVLPTFASDTYELRLDLAAAGIAEGETVTVSLQDPTAGAAPDTFAEPVVFTLEAPAQPAAAGTVARPGGTDLRVVAYNTLSTGLFHDDRGPLIARTIAALRPDVLCLSEEYNGTASTRAALLNDLLPTDAGWSVRKIGDTIIASPYPVLPAPRQGDAAGVVLHPKAGPILFFAIHPRCCGFAGDSADELRIDEFEGIAESIADFRTGLRWTALAEYADAPVVVAGDWNLVGSREPLTLLEDPAGPDLAHVPAVRLRSGDGTTWRSESDGFPPGMLDLIAASRGTLIARNAFVFDSDELSPAELSALGLLPGDASGSDHLPLVADLAVCNDRKRGPADLAEPFGQINVADLLGFLGRYRNADAEADLAAPYAEVNVSDLLAYLGLYRRGGC